MRVENKSTAEVRDRSLFTGGGGGGGSLFFELHFGEGHV